METPGPLALPDRWTGHARGGADWGMQNSQPSGAKGFAVLVGIMVAIVLTIMVIAVILSPR